MLKIDELTGNITLTRGDTMTLTVILLEEIPPVPPATEPTYEPYAPQQGDTIRFAVSKGYKGEPWYELQFKVDVPTDTLTFTCTSEQTSLDYMVYNYDVQIEDVNGKVDTFISGKITITGEAD